MSELRQTLEAALGASLTIERELGGGGMSRVFVARDHTLQRTVVVKVLHSDLAAEVSTERFRREVQLAARLQHPHIVPLISSGDVEGVPYFIMPFIDGESLRTRLDQKGELPVPDAIRIMRDTASALVHAHRHGIVHRDVKPENILLAEDFAVVTDFGIAKALTESATGKHDPGLTTRGIAVGTPAYMAPEQAAADPAVDQRSDIYSFGVVAYEMLTGSPPFAGRSAQSLFAAHAVQEPESIDRRRPGLPPALVALVMQCLQKRPSDRPQTAAAILSALDTLPVSGNTAAYQQSAGWALGRLPLWKQKKMLLVGSAALLAGAALLYGTNRWRSTGSVAASSMPNSLAVLPLVNLSGNSEDEYFSEGMTDELANALSRIPNLNVASRTSAYAFKGRRNLDLTEVGRQLNVGAVVEGSIRRAGNRLRVYAQLANVSNGFVLWSNTFERDASDVFKVQDEIASSVADALRAKLSGNVATIASDARGTQNLRAYDLYLRGRYFLNHRGGDNLRLAVSYFEAALKADDRFARAYAGLAITVALLPEYSDFSATESYRRTLDAAGRALALDSTLAEAYTARGLAYVHDWQRDKAATEYRKAIELDPRYPTAHQWYGEYWYQLGQVDSSLVQIRTAAELDPLAPINASALCFVLTLAGRYDEAIAEAERGIELSPTLGLHRAMLATAYLGKGDNQSAVVQAEKAVSMDPGVPMRRGILAVAYGKVGRREKAVEILRSLQEESKARHVTPYAIGLAYIATGDMESGMRELERAVRERDMVLIGGAITTDPLLEPLRKHPRFPAFVAALGLPLPRPGSRP